MKQNHNTDNSIIPIRLFLSLFHKSMRVSVQLILIIFAIISTNNAFANKDYKVDQENSKTLPPIDTMEEVRKLPPNVFYGRSFSKERKVALTFDDGPFKDYTDKVLDILKKYDVKATFFLVGLRMEENPQIVKRIYEEGHDIGDHSYDHSNFLFLSDEEIIQQIEKTQDIFFELLGIQPLFLRPPRGSVSHDQVILLAQNGFKIVTWSINTYDSYPNINSVDEITQRIIQKLHKGAVILMHDKAEKDLAHMDHYNTIRALPEIIEYLQRQDYRFFTVSELFIEPNLPSDSTREKSEK